MEGEEWRGQNLDKLTAQNIEKVQAGRGEGGLKRFRIMI